MGTIRLTRRPKASAVVGTPGLDLSGARTFDILAQTSFGIAKTIEKNKAITNQVDALKEAQTTDEEIQTGMTEIQNRFNADSSLSPVDGIKEQKLLIDEINIRRLSEIPDKKIRNLVSLRQQQNKIKRLNAANTWALKLQGINHLTKGTEVVNSLANQAENTSEFSVFEDLLEQGNEIARFTATGLNAKQGAKFIKDSPESIAKGYLTGRMKRDPEQGLQDFQTRGIFNTIFDSTEKAQIETDFINAKNGKNVRTNYNSKLRLGTSFSETVEKPEKLDDIDWLNNKKNELDDAGQLTAQIEVDLNRQIDSVLKENKLNAKRDTQTLIDLTVEFEGIGVDDDGVLKNDVNNFEDTFNFMMRLSQARADGKIDDIQYKGMAAPLQAAMELTASEKQPEGFIRRTARAFGNEALRQITGGRFKGWNFQKNPVNFGIKEVDSFLDGASLSPTKEKKVRGAMLIDLYSSIDDDVTNGVEITNESVKNGLIKNIKENSKRFGLPVLSKDGDISFLNLETSQRYTRLDNGDYEMVG